MSLDGFDFEGELIADNTDVMENLLRMERNKQIAEALTHLTDIQRRRHLLYAQGLSIREIARKEKSNYSTVLESIKSAKTAFLKNF